MTLTFMKSTVAGVALGSETTLRGRSLTIDAAGLEELLRARFDAIESVRVSIATPGDRTRVVCVKDVIQPRAKREGAPPGAGSTFVIENVALVTCGPIVGFQEGIIDMSGPGAAYTPFSECHLVVLEIGVRGDLAPHAHEAAVRCAGLFAAEHIAAACRPDAGVANEPILWDERSVDAGLPRVAYVDMALSQGLLHDTWVLGVNASEGLPRILDPRVMLDTGIVSGNCVSACDKNTTWHHQNNPVLRQLLAGHGHEWNFAGAIVTNEPTRLAEKRRSAAQVVELARGLNAHGAILTKEGFGNPDADMMMLIRGLEAAGIRTVAVTDEFAGRDGDSQSLADTTPEADAVISTGNANMPVVLPPMQTVLGPLPDIARLAGGYAWSVRDDGSIEVELQAIVGATNQLGCGRLSCRGV